MDFDTVLHDAIVRVCDLPPERVTPETRLDDLGVDSLAIAEIIVEVEMQLDRELPVHVLRQLDRVTTVGDVAAALGAAMTGAEADA
jgi:acyl carrier protein